MNRTCLALLFSIISAGAAMGQQAAAPVVPPAGVPAIGFQAEVTVGVIRNDSGGNLIEVVGVESFSLYRSSPPQARQYGLRIKLVGSPSGHAFVALDQIESLIATIDYLLGIKESWTRFHSLEAATNIGGPPLKLASSVDNASKGRVTLTLVAEAQLRKLTDSEARAFRSLVVEGRKKIEDLRSK